MGKKVGRKVGRNYIENALIFDSANFLIVFFADLFHPATAGVDCQLPTDSCATKHFPLNSLLLQQLQSKMVLGCWLLLPLLKERDGVRWLLAFTKEGNKNSVGPLRGAGFKRNK